MKDKITIKPITSEPTGPDEGDIWRSLENGLIRMYCGGQVHTVVDRELIQLAQHIVRVCEMVHMSHCPEDWQDCAYAVCSESKNLLSELGLLGLALSGK